MTLLFLFYRCESSLHSSYDFNPMSVFCLGLVFFSLDLFLNFCLGGCFEKSSLLMWCHICVFCSQQSAHYSKEENEDNYVSCLVSKKR